MFKVIFSLPETYHIQRHLPAYPDYACVGTDIDTSAGGVFLKKRSVEGWPGKVLF